MKTKHLDYSIIIEKDVQTGTSKPMYTAYCPSLGIADDGFTLEEAVENIKALIEFHLENLAQEGKPVEKSAEAVFAKVQVKTPSNLRFVV